MIFDGLTILTILAGLGSGLIAGVFFAFSTFVMGALARLPADQGIAAMKAINVVVLRSLFMVAFFGTAALGAGLAGAALFRWEAPAAAFWLAGGALYLIGAFLVTLRGNVPLNVELAAAEPGSAAGAETWARYLSRWGRWNHLRTVAALLAALAYMAALAGP